MINTSTNQNIKTLFFFSAKKVKRDFLYQSKETLQKRAIKLSKPSAIIEKNIRKIRLLDNIFKSSTLVGISRDEFTLEQLKELVSIDIPGLDFIGVLSGNEYISKNRLNTKLVSNDDVFFSVYKNLLKMPQILSSSFVYTASLTSSYTGVLKGKK
jgi:hypothetical protein